MPLRLVVKNRDHFVSVVKAAKQMGGKSLDSFHGCLEYLCKPAEGSVNAQRNRQIIIGRDFAPMSFVFAVVGDGGKLVLNGGMIFHPARSNGVSGEMSVVLTPQDFGHWSLHT